MTHHPHVHMIITGGGISPDGSRWIASRPDYLVPVEVLSALFRGRMLGMLIDAHAAGRLEFFGDYEHLADNRTFKAYLAPCGRRTGSSTPNVHSPAPSRCWPMFPATPIASPLPTVV
jgi:Putative transposase